MGVPVPEKVAIDGRGEFDLQIQLFMGPKVLFDRFNVLARFIAFRILGHNFTAEVIGSDAHLLNADSLGSGSSPNRYCRGRRT